MAHFNKQMEAEAHNGCFRWKKATPFSRTQRRNLRAAGFSVGRDVVHWNNMFKAVPKDCRPFVSGATVSIPARYNDAQRLWLIATRESSVRPAVEVGT